MVNIRKNLMPSYLYGWKSPYEMTPTRIVVHNTYNDASADAEIRYMNKSSEQGGVQTSFHYAVDDKEIVQGLPENRNSWNAGDGGNGKGNREGIAIEICYSLSGGSRFIKAEENAVDLIVDILKRYGWGIDKVTKHQDYANKYCPHRTLDMGWDRFINIVKEKLEGKPVDPHDFLPERGWLQKGDSGDNVKALCDFLYKVFPSYAKVLGRNKKDLLGNYYGSNCEAWIKEFQKRTGLEQDGCTGPITYKELQKYGFKY